MSETGTKTFVGTKAAEEQLEALLQRPGMANAVQRIRNEMDEDDRVYASNLASIRKAAALTQTELAEKMGVAQSAVSHLESQQHDMLLSTLTRYLRSTGDRPRVVVTMNGHDVELDLAEFV